MTNQLPEEVYATIAGGIDTQMVQKIFQAGATAVNGGVKMLHLLIHSMGGSVADGIALYNYLHNLPLKLTTYNAGSVSSAAVLIFLAGQTRRSSESANFMIHRTGIAPNPMSNAIQLQSLVDSLVADDVRTEKIYREYIKMPDDKWKLHEQTNLFITAKEAVDFALIHEIADFKPPTGAQLFNL